MQSWKFCLFWNQAEFHTDMLASVLRPPPGAEPKPRTCIQWTILINDCQGMGAEDKKGWRGEKENQGKRMSLSWVPTLHNCSLALSGTLWEPMWTIFPHCPLAEGVKEIFLFCLCFYHTITITTTPPPPFPHHCHHYYTTTTTTTTPSPWPWLFYHGHHQQNSKISFLLKVGKLWRGCSFIKLVIFDLRCI